LAPGTARMPGTSQRSTGACIAIGANAPQADRENPQKSTGISLSGVRREQNLRLPTMSPLLATFEKK